MPRWWRPHAVSDVVVSRPPPTRLNMMLPISSSLSSRPSSSSCTRNDVRSSAGRRRRSSACSSSSTIISGAAPSAAWYSGDPAVCDAVAWKDSRVVLPVTRREAHHLQRQHRGNRGGVVEHEIHRSLLDDRIEEPRRHRFHRRLQSGDGLGRKCGVQRAPQRVVVRPVGLGDTDLRHRRRAGSRRCPGSRSRRPRPVRSGGRTSRCRGRRPARPRSR